MTIGDNRLPIEVDALEDTEGLPVKPGTNAHAILAVLAAHPDLAFTPSELAELADVQRGSVSKTLSRLADEGLVRSIDGYWTVADDFAAGRLAGYVSLAAIEARYGEDEYGREEAWADDTADLGENA